MARLSGSLSKILNSDCGHDIEQVLRKKRKQDFSSLRKFLSARGAINDRRHQRALYLLGRWGDPAQVSLIEKLLPRLDETRLITAIDALGRLGTREAANCVLRFKKNPSENVRRFVVHALEKMKFPEVQVALGEISRKDRVNYVRELALKRIKKKSGGFRKKRSEVTN